MNELKLVGNQLDFRIVYKDAGRADVYLRKEGEKEEQIHRDVDRFYAVAYCLERLGYLNQKDAVMFNQINAQLKRVKEEERELAQ